MPLWPFTTTLLGKRSPKPTVIRFCDRMRDFHFQKNVRKFMGVRGWPWWRLLIKITPMLNVHRTEDMLKSKSEELESLRARLEKVSSTTFNESTNVCLMS